MDKSKQGEDWTQLPLPPAMVEYALTDSRVLPPLYEELVGRLEAMGMGAYRPAEFKIRNYGNGALRIRSGV